MRYAVATLPEVLILQGDHLRVSLLDRARGLCIGSMHNGLSWANSNQNQHGFHQVQTDTRHRLCPAGLVSLVSTLGKHLCERVPSTSRRHSACRTEGWLAYPIIHSRKSKIAEMHSQGASCLRQASSSCLKAQGCSAALSRPATLLGMDGMSIPEGPLA